MSYVVYGNAHSRMNSLHHFSLYEKCLYFCFIKQARLVAIVSNFFGVGVGVDNLSLSKKHSNIILTSAERIIASFISQVLHFISLVFCVNS
jgi:hypothetical protein